MDTPRADKVERDLDDASRPYYEETSNINDEYEEAAENAVSLARQLERELAEARKDAERYRWLRDKGDSTWLAFNDRPMPDGYDIDAAIDAAMASPPTEKG